MVTAGKIGNEGSNGYHVFDFTKDSLRTCEEQLVWIFAGYDEINYHLVIGRNYSQFILGNGVC